MTESASKARPKCGKKTRAGTPCDRPAGWGTGHPGSGPCKLHGGASLRGFAHPNYQGKGYSRYIPKPLEATITAFLEAGDHLDLVQAIGTWEGRITSLLQAIDQAGAPAELWTGLATELEGLWRAIDAGQIERALQHRQAIDGLVRSGQSHADAWEQLQRAEETRLKLVETEDKKRERARGYVTAEQLRFQNNALRLAVVEGTDKIQDPDLRREVRRTIAERFIQVVGPAALPGSAAADEA